MPQRKNAFYYFMLEYKAKRELTGKKFRGLRQVSRECAETWRQLSDNDRLKYVRLRNASKNSCHGVPMALVAREQKLLQESKNRMKNTIDQVISNAILANNLDLITISIISFNYFCQSNDLTYTPAEAAVINFNLENGIIDSYHTLVNPITLPLGMAFVAKNHADDTHRLPVPPDASGETDYGRIYENLYSLMFDDEMSILRPVFTRDADVDMVKSILNILAVEANKPVDTIDVFPIHAFFYELKKATVQLGEITGGGFPSIHLAKACLERDAFEFHSNLACEKHEDLDTPNVCSLSIVKRWAFTIADNCCLDLNINLIPGQHLPVDAKLPDFKFESECDPFKVKTENIKKEDDDDDTLYESSNFYTDSEFSRRGKSDRCYQDGASSMAMSSTVKQEDDDDKYGERGFVTMSKRKRKLSPMSSSSKQHY